MPSEPQHPLRRTDSVSFALVALALALPLAPAQAGPLKLHVPSPDWRDQILYFVMTDRFADGNPRNNDQGAGVYRPGQAAYYQGGDLTGLRLRLPYIQALGATGVWITPPVRNQWFDPWVGYSGYHGYWASHFKQVDPHLGTLSDLQRLSDALHRRSMVLVQDIVVNHVGNFFNYPFDGTTGWDPADPTRFYQRQGAPVQPPFDQNDPRRPGDRAAGIYHWTPPVADYGDPEQERRWQMGGLDDLATSNPRVRRALRESFGWWIRNAGVDGFRVDTAFYVEPEFFEDFLHSRDHRAPGIAAVARATGRQQFHVFGEGFAIDRPYGEDAARKVDRWMREGGAGPNTRLPGMLNFPLYGSLAEVFARGHAPAELAHRIESMLRLHAQPHLMPSFIDNHDVDRFAAGSSPAALRQALLALMTLPGIPVIYYGTEQGFTRPRAAMFAAGWGSGGRDHYDTAHPLFRSIAAMTALRREHRLFSRGVPVLRRADAAAPGALAWTTAHEGRQALVIFNTADHEVLVDALETGAAPGTRLQPLLGLDGPPAAHTLGEDGRITLRLPPRAGWVWALQPAEAPGTAVRTGPARASTEVAAAPALQLDALPAEPARGEVVVSGHAAPGQRLWLVVDGDIARAQVRPPVQAGPDGRWQARLPTAGLIDPALRHRVVAWDGDQQTSPPRHFQAEADWQLLADLQDPAGDDHGPQHLGLATPPRYAAPLDPGFAGGVLDIRRVQAWASGGALRLDVELGGISTVWSPANGFDHLALTLYLALPGSDEGSGVLPLQQAAAPLRWHRRLRVHGWSNVLTADAQASATHEGRPVAPGARVQVDAASRRIRITLPAAATGVGSLTGARLYLTTWDYDGGYRALAAEPGMFVFGGADPAQTGGGPKVMDDLPVIILGHPLAKR